MQWAAALGGALLLACQYFANGPHRLYAKSEFWLNSPAQVLSKLGVTLLVLAFGFLWTRYGAKPGWSWVRQFGTASLLVYWVHIELVYGRWLGAWKESLDNTQVMALSGVVIGLMLALSLLRTSARKWKTIPAVLRWNPFTSTKPSYTMSANDRRSL